MDTLTKLKKKITKTYQYNFDLFKPHFCIVKLVFTWVYIIFLIPAQKHRLWVLIRPVSLSVVIVYLSTISLNNISSLNHWANFNQIFQNDWNLFKD